MKEHPGSWAALLGEFDSRIPRDAILECKASGVEQGDLLVDEYLIVRQPLRAFFGHAVETAEVARVRHRDPQVVVPAAVTVEQLRGYPLSP